MDDFTKNERSLADAQGWALVDVYDVRGYFAYMVAPAPNSRMATPYEAAMFVWQRARTGDTVCRRALSLVAASELAGKSSKKRKRK